MTDKKIKSVLEKNTGAVDLYLAVIKKIKNKKHLNPDEFVMASSMHDFGILSRNSKPIWKNGSLIGFNVTFCFEESK